jgi:hypothetical protein
MRVSLKGKGDYKIFGLVKLPYLHLYIHHFLPIQPEYLTDMNDNYS